MASKATHGTGTNSLRADLRRGLELLEHCSNGDVVLDSYGHAWQRASGYWYRAYGDDQAVSVWELCQRAPFKRMEVAK